MSVGSKSISLASELARAREGVLRRKTQSDMLEAQAKSKIAVAEAAQKEMAEIADSVALVQAFAGQIQTGIIERFEDLINRGIREIFKEDYKVQVVFEAKSNSFWADLYITLPGGNRVPMSKQGGGMKHLAAVLSRILYIVLDPTQPAKFMLLDETMKDLDEWRYPEGFRFIMDVATQLGIQVVWTTHSPVVSSKQLDIPGAVVMRFDIHDGKTVVKQL